MQDVFSSTVWPSTLHFGVLVASQAILKQHCRCHQNVPPSDHHVAAVGILQRLPAMSSRARGSGMESIWRPSLPDNENKRRGSLTFKMKTQLSSNTKYSLESFIRIVLMLLSPKWFYPWKMMVGELRFFCDSILWYKLSLQQQMEKRLGICWQKWETVSLPFFYRTQTVGTLLGLHSLSAPENKLNHKCFTQRWIMMDSPKIVVSMN